jgi:predicted metal-dependent peptidase
MQIKNIHEKLMESIQQMLIDTKVNLPYYGNFNLFITFHERKDIDTCGVNMTAKGMQFYYSSEFLDRMSQKETNFITLHEDFHLLWNHPKRTITGQYDHKLSNIAQDMIINHIIWEDIPNNYVEIPKDPNGRNMALFVPKEYPGKLIFEELYEWLRDEKEKHDKKKQQNQCSTCNGTGQKQDSQKGNQPGEGQGQGEKQDGQGQGEKQDGQGQDEKQDSQGQGEGQGQGGKQDGHNHGESGEPCPDCQGSGQKGGGKGQPKYGPYGKDPKNEKGNIDTYSMDQIFDDLDNNQGQYMDVHMTDEVPEEMRESMVKDAMERLQARGLQAGNVEQTLNKLRKQRKDYLKHIKRSVSNMIFGTKKQKTITKPNRRQLSGLKGNRKIKTKINCILDTSGSMGGTFERVLSYIYRNDIEVNLIEADTEVKWVQAVKSKRKLESIPIKGLGGTVLQPAINYVADNFNEFNTLVLTDGYCDSLDLSKIKGNVLLISIGTEVPITRTNGKVKQIKVDLDDNR